MTVRLDYEPYDLGGMTWEDAEEAISDADFVVLPTGSVEQHSLHLPVTVDTLRAESLSRGTRPMPNPRTTTCRWFDCRPSPTATPNIT